MELIRMQSLPKSVQSLTRTGEDTQPDVRVSLYLPNYRSGRGRIWKISRKLLAQARQLMLTGLSEEETNRRIEIIEERIFVQPPPGQEFEAHKREHDALGYAYFLDGANLDVQALDIRPEPLVVVSNSFHVRPLLQSIAQEPHQRIVILGREQASIHRREHDSLVEESLYYFPDLAEKQGDRRGFVSPRENARDFEKVWRHMEEFSQALLSLQNSDPRPLALFGPDDLRKVFIEDVRSQLTRPIYLQGSITGSLRDMCRLADEAFADRLTDESPLDVEETTQTAYEKGCLVTELDEIFHEAQRGNVESLLVTKYSPLWGEVDAFGHVELHEEQQDFKDDCIIDDAVEYVLKHDGGVLFCHPEKTEIVSPSGMYGILREPLARDRAEKDRPPHTPDRKNEDADELDLL